MKIITRVRTLSLAEADLYDGFLFYERKETGVGSYFIESLSSDIESLRLYAGVHRRVFGYHRMLAKRFRSESITISKETRPASGECWTAGRTLDGLENT